MLRQRAGEVGRAPRGAVLAMAAIGLLGACAGPGESWPGPRSEPLSSYVVVGEGGTAIARVVTRAPACPMMRVDGEPRPMQQRAAPGRLAPRPGQLGPAVEFAPRVCEAAVPEAARSVAVEGFALPLAKRPVRRILVLGDTGCRIKAADAAFQDCQDPAQWPFAQLAQAAAREAPDLVVHVGDYQYRESPCPSGAPCAGSLWGYGWEAWNADFFAPGRQLLAAAPWVVVRGNHEECARAGQGWFRFLDPRPWDPGRSCDRPQDDERANFSEPYAVPLGEGWQLIVFDSALASRPPDPRRAADRHREQRYRQQAMQVARLAAAPGLQSIFLSHHPVMGFVGTPAGLDLGTPALWQPLRAVTPDRIFPAGVELAVHGHVHAFEAVDFSSGQPPTLVAGHGGDLLDADFSDESAAVASAPDGVRVASLLHASGFGYLVLDREGSGWRLRARRLDGGDLAVCGLREGRLDCVPRSHPF